MSRQLRSDIDLPAIGMIDPQPPRMQMQLAADAPCQERLLPGIFAVADDRVTDRRQMHAQLMGSAGQRLQLQPGGPIARPFDQAVAAARGEPIGLIDMHLLAAGAGLLRDRQIDRPLAWRGHAHHQRPIDLARRPSGKGFGKGSGCASRAGQQQHARRIFVQPMDQLGPLLAWFDQSVEQRVDMNLGLGAALSGEPGRLVEDDRRRIAVDHQLVDEGDFVLAQRAPLRRGPGGAPWLGRWDANLLACLESVAGGRPLAIDAQLAGACPAGHDIEAGVGQIALEPAIEPDAVIIRRHGELANLTYHQGGLCRRARQYAKVSACTLAMKRAASGPSQGP